MSTIERSRFFKARPFEPKDAATVALWMSRSPEELFMLSSSLTFPVEADTIVEYAEKTDPGTHRLYSVLLVDTDNHVGHFEIKNVNERHRIGTGAHIILSHEYRGKGMGRDLVELLTKVGFSTLDLHRISLSVHTVNRNAIAAYVKAGYIIEGLIRDVLFFDGKRYSLYQLSILRNEWEAQRLLEE